MKPFTAFNVIFLFLISSSAHENDFDSEFPEDKCADLSSEDCRKMDTLEIIVDKLAHKRSVKLLPGLILETGGYQSDNGENETVRGSVTFEKLISLHLQQFFSSIALKIKVVDKETVEKITLLTNNLTSSGESRGSTPRIRRPNNMNNTILLGALISAATMLAMTLSALSAMAGKAVAMSAVSLGLSMMGHNNGHGHGGWHGNHGKAVEVHHTHSTSIGSMPTATHPAPVPMHLSPHDPYKSTSNYFKYKIYEWISRIFNF